MYLSYFDESGDDGYPLYSSEIFVLSSIYMHFTTWKNNYSEIRQFRQYLKRDFEFPIKQEFHTREFVTDKDPYHGKYDLSTRMNILTRFCRFIGTLEIKIISVAIDKQRIQRPKYDVLKNALTYNIQRIENDLNHSGSDAKFLIITDEGRVGKMRKTTRAIQRINYIPSMFGQAPYRKEIRCLIEDPLPKSSEESYFIQLADVVSFVVSLYVRRNLCSPVVLDSKRIRNVIADGAEIELMNLIKPRMNEKASKSNPYGVVYYPK